MYTYVQGSVLVSELSSVQQETRPAGAAFVVLLLTVQAYVFLCTSLPLMSRLES